MLRVVSFEKKPQEWLLLMVQSAYGNALDTMEFGKRFSNRTSSSQGMDRVIYHIRFIRGTSYDYGIPTKVLMASEGKCLCNLAFYH